MRVRRAIAALIPSLALAAAPAQATAPSIEDGSAQRALDAARAKWHAAAPRNYTYRVTLSCFCDNDSRRPRTFVVRGGRPRNTPRGQRRLNTGAKLFRIVQQAIDQRADRLTVRYRRNGLLRQISVDAIEEAQDDEYTYTVDRFRRLR